MMRRTHQMMTDEESYNSKKQRTRWDLADWSFFREICEVLSDGAVKYSENGWQRMEEPDKMYFSAAVRHLDKWKEGSKLDDGEDGDNKSHLVHAACNLMFLYWFDKKAESNGPEA